MNNRNRVSQVCRKEELNEGGREGERERDREGVRERERMERANEQNIASEVSQPSVVPSGEGLEVTVASEPSTLSPSFWRSTAGGSPPKNLQRRKSEKRTKEK